MEEIPRSTNGATWGSGGNPTKLKRSDVGHRWRKLRFLSSGETVNAHSVAIVFQLRLSVRRGPSAAWLHVRQYATVIWLHACAGVSNSLTNASA